MIRRRKNRLAALEREAVELRGLIQQTNAALAKLRADHEREVESLTRVINSRTEHLT